MWLEQLTQLGHFIWHMIIVLNIGKYVLYWLMPICILRNCYEIWVWSVSHQYHQYLWIWTDRDCCRQIWYLFNFFGSIKNHWCGLCRDWFFAWSNADSEPVPMTHCGPRSYYIGLLLHLGPVRDRCFCVDWACLSGWNVHLKICHFFHVVQCFNYHNRQLWKICWYHSFVFLCILFWFFAMFIGKISRLVDLRYMTSNPILFFDAIKFSEHFLKCLIASSQHHPNTTPLLNLCMRYL